MAHIISLDRKDSCSEAVDFSKKNECLPSVPCGESVQKLAQTAWPRHNRSQAALDQPGRYPTGSSDQFSFKINLLRGPADQAIPDLKDLFRLTGNLGTVRDQYHGRSLCVQICED